MRVFTCNCVLFYRDSKLTRVLQDSLRGNSRIVLIVTISSSVEHTSETLATLRFGERAKRLTTRPKVNVDMNVLFDEKEYKKALNTAQSKIHTLGVTITELHEQIKSLQQQNQQLRMEKGNNEQSGAPQQMQQVQQLCYVCAGPMTPTASTATAPIAVKKPKPVPAGSVSGDEATSKLPPIHPNNPRKPVVAASSVDNASSKSKPATKPSIKSSSPRSAASNSTYDSDSDNDSNKHLIPIAHKDTHHDSSSPFDPNFSNSNRCAVCNLDDVDTEQLRRDTGEVLGSLFMCDGNCGQTFHVRCVGLVGDGGQFMLPEGEWLCSMCSLDVDTDGANNNGSEYDSDGGVCVDDADSVDDNHSSSTVTRSRNNSAPLIRDALSQLNDLTFDGGEGGKQISSHSLSSSTSLLSSSIEADYHIMRRERNRILQQWQHEKKISKLIADQRTKQDEQRDREVVELYNEVRGLKDEVNNKEINMRILQQEKEELMKRLHDALATQAQSHQLQASGNYAQPSVAELITSATDHTGLRNEDSNRGLIDTSNIVEVSISSDSVTRMPKLTLLSRSLDSKVPSGYAFDPLRAAMTSSASASSKNEKVSAHSNNTDSSNENTNNNNNSSSGGGGGGSIPKPWMNNTSSGSSKKKQAAAGSSSAKSTSKSLTSLPAAATQVTSVSSSSAKLLPLLLYDNDEQSNVDNNVNIESLSTTENSSNSHPSSLGDPTDESAPMSSSDFLGPMQSRLKGLLQAVKAETDSYAEIRMRHLEREGERSSLRSSHTQVRSSSSSSSSAAVLATNDVGGSGKLSAVDKYLGNKIQLNERLISAHHRNAANDSL
jgi:regulator of replication initiation timing